MGDFGLEREMTALVSPLSFLLPLHSYHFDTLSAIPKYFLIFCLSE